MKRCSKCGKLKPLEDFHKDKQYKDGYKCWCKECCKEYYKERYRKNIEKCRDTCRKWRQKNPNYHKNQRRKKRIEILKRLGNKCIKCEYDKDWRAFQIDHIHGGGTKERKTNFNNSSEVYYNYLLSLPIEELKENYQLLCANCNQIKRYENKEYNNKYTETSS